MNYYWSSNFNSASALLGGAVVAGEGENTAIYYNPATISEMEKGNSFSFTSSLFTYNAHHYKNMLGDGITMYEDYLVAQPPFISYANKSKKNNKFSLAITILTKAKEDMRIYWAGSQYYNVLTNLPGDDKYNASFNYRNYYLDFWVGGAVAYELTPKLSVGASLFVSIVSLKYVYGYSTSAYSVNDTLDPEIYPQASRVAYNDYRDNLKFTDYRILFKFGVLYTTGSWRFGLNITTPTIYLFSAGKDALSSKIITNISTSQNTSLPDYEIFDSQYGSQLKTNFKLPLSVSAGFIKDFHDGNKRLYLTVEYFNRIQPYKLVTSQPDDNISNLEPDEELQNYDWLSYARGTRNFINFAIGYSCKLKKRREFLNSFRTDFSSIRNVDLGEYSNYKTLHSFNYNVLHYAAGLKFNIKKSNFIAGAQFSLAYNNHLKQVTNFTTPLEINEVDDRVLQGVLDESMSVLFWGISVYIGANLNFIQN